MIKEHFNGTIFLYNCQETVVDYEDLHAKSIVPASFREVLENHFPTKINHNHKTVKHKNYTLYWHGPTEIKSTSLEVDYYGKGGLLELVELCKKHHWQMFHCVGKGIIIDLDNPIWE